MKLFTKGLVLGLVLALGGEVLAQQWDRINGSMQVRSSTTTPLVIIDQVGTGKILSLRDNGTEVSAITGAGFILSSAGSLLRFPNGTKLGDSIGDGVALFTNAAGLDFSRLQFGGTTSSFPSLKRQSAQLNVRLADDSADAAMTASIFQASTALVGPGTVADSGAIRLANATGVTTRNNANSANFTLISSNSFDQLVLAGGSTDIQWGRALVALGGGAAPTLGTIGGSGPATAAQNTWLRMIDSTGAAFWVPVWK